MKNLLLIIAALLIPTAIFADENTTATGSNPTPASAKKTEVKEKCVIPKLKHEKNRSTGKTITDPIPETLSDKCYCQAVADIYSPNSKGRWD